VSKTNVVPIGGEQDRRPSDSQSHNPPVSALSKFDDLTWDFNEEITNPSYTKGGKIIRWDFDVRQGEGFDDPKFASLMLACKQLFYAMLWHPERNGRCKPETVIQRWRFLRPFAVFMVNRAHPIYRFKDVTKHVIEEYLKRLRLPNKSGGKRVNEGIYHYLAGLKLLYVYRRKISEPLQFDPFDGESPSKALGLKRHGAQSKTECIPDDLLRKLITSALDYVKHSDALFAAAAFAERIRQERPEVHRGTIAYHTKRLVKGAIAHLEVRDEVSFSLGVLTQHAIAAHLIRLRTACFILIAFVTGMRISELLSLEAGCVERECTDDGEFVWINSSLHKTLGSGRATPAKWLCGQVAATAVSVLESMTSKLRRATGYRSLFVPVTKWGAHTWNGKTVGANDLGERLKDYVQWLDLRDERGNPFRLHAHMFRRTFARHVVRSDTTGLLALKDHFKHVSLAMTDYYVGVDEELQDMLNDEANRLSFESFDKALRSDRLGGPRGKELARQIDAAMADGRLPPEFRGESGSHLRAEMIAEWVAAGQQIYPCGPGNVCWFREGSAMCTKGDRPVVEICNPIGCNNSVVLPEHAPHWRSIEERAEALLGLEPAGEPYKQRLYMIVKIAKRVREDIS
jgi:integrase